MVSTGQLKSTQVALNSSHLPRHSILIARSPLSAFSHHRLSRHRNNKHTRPHGPPAFITRANHADYAANAGDDAVLQRPLKSELFPEEIVNVFGYPRDLREVYDVGIVMGAGSFGIVRLAIEKSTGRKYACKTIPKTPKSGHPTPRYLLKLQTEVDAMSQLGASLDAVFLKDVYEDDTHVHLVMELCEGGSVLDRLKIGEYGEAQVAQIMASVLRFLSQCHAKNLIYRDVKPENFMLLHKIEVEELPKGALARFGRAVGISSNKQPSSNKAQLLAPIKATDFGLSIRHKAGEAPLKSRSGTPAYMAPEVIQQSYAEEADVWSAGIMMYQLLTGKFPFWDNVRDCTLTQVWKAILTEKVDFNGNDLRQVSPGAKDLLRKMLIRDRKKRITASEALSHPWLKDSSIAPSLPLRSSVVQRLQRFATYGYLKQLVLRIMADELDATLMSESLGSGVGSSDSFEDSQNTMEVLGSLKGLFDELDVDASGTVSMDELAAGLDRLGYDISATEIEQLMARVDVNQDGSIQMGEFVAGLVDWNVLQRDNDAWDRWVSRAFDKLDRNGDGVIDLDELMEEVPDSSSNSSGGSNGSGGGGQISGGRLLEARRMLREADENGDGKVSREEFRELLVGSSSTPDSLSQYDPRLKHFAIDEDLGKLKEEVRSGSGKVGKAVRQRQQR